MNFSFHESYLLGSEMVNFSLITFLGSCLKKRYFCPSLTTLKKGMYNV
jgi:hypothetical protein